MKPKIVDGFSKICFIIQPFDKLIKPLLCLWYNIILRHNKNWQNKQVYNLHQYFNSSQPDKDVSISFNLKTVLCHTNEHLHCLKAGFIQNGNSIRRRNELTLVVRLINERSEVEVTKAWVWQRDYIFTYWTSKQRR